MRWRRDISLKHTRASLEEGNIPNAIFSVELLKTTRKTKSNFWERGRNNTSIKYKEL